jgi:hypothetical protein
VFVAVVRGEVFLRLAVQTTFVWVSASAISLLAERDRVLAGEGMGIQGAGTSAAEVRGENYFKFCLPRFLLNFRCVIMNATSKGSEVRLR